MNARQHANAVNNAQTDAQRNQAIRNAENDGYFVQSSENYQTGTSKVQVGKFDKDGNFVPEHGQIKTHNTEDFGRTYEERTTDVTYKDGEIVGVQDRKTGEYKRNEEGGYDRVESPEAPQDEVEMPDIEEPAETETPDVPNEDPPTESSPPSENDSPETQQESPETQKEEPTDDDPEKKSEETDCGKLCKAGSFALGVLEGMVVGAAVTGTLALIATSSIAGAPLIAAGLGLLLAGKGIYDLATTDWGSLTARDWLRLTGGVIGGGLGARGALAGVGRYRNRPLKVRNPEEPEIGGNQGQNQSQGGSQQNTQSNSSSKNRGQGKKNKNKGENLGKNLDPRTRELARDLENGGRITKKTIGEAKYIQEVEAAGKVKAPVRRAPAKGDFIDGDGNVIDVKMTDKSSWKGLETTKGMKDFKHKTGSAIRNEGERQIIDSRNLKPTQLRELKKWKIENGWTDDQLYFWPE